MKAKRLEKLSSAAFPSLSTGDSARGLRQPFKDVVRRGFPNRCFVEFI